eukprot:6460575-Amphidinium_carterae.1
MFFVVDTTGEPEWHFILDKNVPVYLVCWSSPWHTMHQTSLSYASHCRIKLLNVAGPMPFLEAAARHAFWEATATQLKRLSSELGVTSVVGNPEVHNVIAKLCSHLIPGFSESSLIDALLHQIPRSETRFDALLNDPNMLDHIDKSDRDNFERTKSKHQKQEAETVA